jgi:chloramphenicol O-acetyltransferase type A
MDRWPRREHFEHFSRKSPCLWSMTAHVDVSELAARLRSSDRKTYIAQLWMLATVVNRHDEFRMTIDAAGDLAVWDVTHPFFTVFNPTAETFSTVWAAYHPDFAVFHESALPLLTEYRNSTSYVPQREIPENTFDVSSLPWTSFTSLELQLKDAWTYLAPIFTIGKYEQRDRRRLPHLPTHRGGDRSRGRSELARPEEGTDTVSVAAPLLRLAGHRPPASQAAHRDRLVAHVERDIARS